MSMTYFDVYIGFKRIMYYNTTTSTLKMKIRSAIHAKDFDVSLYIHSCIYAVYRIYYIKLNNSINLLYYNII